MNAAGNRWQGLAARAADVSISGSNSGFRPDWQLPDWSYPPGVQEIVFVTHSSEGKPPGTHSLSDGSAYTKPYRTLFRFPLDPATGQPFPAGVGLNIPTYVSCSCPAFRFYCEEEARGEQSSDTIYSNGGPYRTNRPTYICKHLVATAKKAIQLRRKVGNKVTSDTNQSVPNKQQPKNRSTTPPRQTPGGARRTGATTRADSVNPPTRRVAATSGSGIPQSWVGRLMYILFNERTGR